MNRPFAVFFVTAVLVSACACSPISPTPPSNDETPSSKTSSSSSETSLPSSQMIPDDSNSPKENPANEFDFSLPQERYLFFTADDPTMLFEIATQDSFAGWTADLVSFAGEDAGPDPVNLRASFSGSVLLSGDIVTYYDQLSGSQQARFYPDEESLKAIPRFYGEDPENLYTLELEGENFPAALLETFGEPQVRERVLGEETFSETFYPDCTILASRLFIQIGSDLQGKPAVMNVYTLTAALGENS